MNWYTFVAFIILPLLSSCAGGDQQPQSSAKTVPPKASTQRMISTLDSILNSKTINSNATRSTQRMEKYKNDYLTDAQKSPTKYKLYLTEFIRTGRYAEALMQIQQVFPDGVISRKDLNDKTAEIYELLGNGYMLLGLDQHNKPMSLPIDSRQRMADPQFQDASNQFFDMLSDSFKLGYDNRVKLNYNHMFLGSYPSGLMQDKVLSLTKMNAKTFTGSRAEEAAATYGVQTKGTAGGAAWLDIDSDGDEDMIQTGHLLTEQVIVLQNDNGTFKDVTASSGLQGLTGGDIVSTADVDNDGDLDVLIGRGRDQYIYGQFPNSLLINNGDGTFEDIGMTCGLLDYAPTSSVAWADFNKDGYLDVFVANGAYRGAHKSKLYRNNGNLTFTEISEGISDFLDIHATSAVWIDTDGDGYPALMVGNGKGTGVFFTNDKGTLKIANNPLTSHTNTIDICLTDVENDGDLDLIFLSDRGLGVPPPTLLYGELMTDEVQSMNALYLNNGKGGFSKSDLIGGLGMVDNSITASVIDYDNDGYEDIYLNTGGQQPEDLLPNRLFRNMSGLGFEEITLITGTGLLTKSSGVAMADIDQDGDIDIYSKGGGYYDGDKTPSALFVNPTASTTVYRLQLIGKLNNRMGIGTKVVFEGTLPDGTSSQVVRWIHSGHGLTTYASSLPIAVGKLNVNAVNITWPDGLQQSISDLPADNLLVFDESKG